MTPNSVRKLILNSSHLLERGRRRLDSAKTEEPPESRQGGMQVKSLSEKFRRSPSISPSPPKAQSQERRYIPYYEEKMRDAIRPNLV